MTRLTWEISDYEVGVSRGVFYPENSPGEVWPGLIEIQDATEAGDNKATALDGRKLFQRGRSLIFTGKISAYFFPESYFLVIHRGRQKFGFTWRVEKKNGYEIHILYNVLASPDIVEYKQQELSQFDVSISTSPVMLPEGGFSSHFIVDTEIADPRSVSDLEGKIYGSDVIDPYLPDLLELIETFEPYALLRVIDNGDGTFTVIGPDEAIAMIDSTTFEITWPSVVLIDANTYKISSL